MRGLKFAIAVGVTSLVLVAAIGGAGLLAVRSVLASSPVATFATIASGPWVGGPHLQLPPQLQGLTSLPADQRFAHFDGVQVNLKDQNNNPLTINVTPGTVTSASKTSLSITANDGSAKTYTLSSSTAIHGLPPQGSAQGSQPTIAKGDKVVVVTVNSDTTPMAVVDGGPNGFSGGPGGGPWNWGHHAPTQQ